MRLPGEGVRFSAIVATQHEMDGFRTAARSMKAGLLATVVATGAMCASAPAAYAQATQPQVADSGGSEIDIVVTATRRTERLQDVPISVQALGQEALERQNISNFDDYAKLLPSVSYQSFGPGQSQLSFRGITSGGDGLDVGSLPTAGTYIDDVPVTTIGGTPDLHVYDVARVEALSGPQGTLFGASSLAGTLRIITNKPDPSKFEGGYDLQLNKFGKGDFGGSVEGFVNLPLSDSAAIRLVGYYKRDGGYIDNTLGTRTYELGDLDPETNLTIDNSRFVKKDFNEVESYGGRAALRVDLDDDWTVTTGAIYQKQNSEGAFLFDPRVGDLKVHDFTPDYNKDRWYQATLTLEGKIGNWDLIYSGGYFNRRVQNQQDYSYYTVAYDIPGYYYTNFPDGDGGFLDPTQEQTLDYRYKKYTNELRVSSPQGEAFRITAGLFMQRQVGRLQSDYSVPGLGSVPVEGLPGGVPIPGFGDRLFYKQLHRVDRDYAMFAQADYDLTDQLTLTAGIRGFMVKNTLYGFSGFASAIGTPGCIPTDDPKLPSCANVKARVVESGETHKVSLAWKIDRDRMIYATYSTGYRPGGNNRDARYGPYKSDTLSNYEIGFKTLWMGGRLRFNGAFFYQEWKDMQFALARPGDNGVTSISNVGGARSKGAEVDILYSAGGLQLSGTASYVDAELTSAFCESDFSGTVRCTPKGTRLPVQPRFKANATARYTFAVGSNEAFVQAGVAHQGGTRSFLLDGEVDVVGYTKAFTTADFSTGLSFNDMSLELFIQNAFDSRGQLSRNSACAPAFCGQYYRIYPIRPQQFGIKFGHRF